MSALLENDRLSLSDGKADLPRQDADECPVPHFNQSVIHIKSVHHGALWVPQSAAARCQDLHLAIFLSETHLASGDDDPTHSSGVVVDALLYHDVKDVL